MGEDRPGGRERDAGQALLAGLEELARTVGIEVRIEPFELKIAGKGGFCRVNDERVILVDAKLTLIEQAGVIGEALGQVLPEDVEIPAALAPYVRTGHAAVRRLLRPRPLARGR